MTRSDSFQHPAWREHYEKGWNLRLDFMKKLVDQGERNPYRIIHALEKRERKHQIIYPKAEEPYWKHREFPEPSEFLPSGLPILRESSLRGKVIQLPYYTNLRQHDFIVDMLDLEDFDCIAELGCGIGKNLFEIYYNSGPRDIPYIGAELTDSGVEAGRLLSSLDGDINIEMFKFDFMKPDLSFLNCFKNVFLFTFHAIEFIHLISDELIRVLAQCAERIVCVHFEPFGFQIDPNLGDATRAQNKFFLKQEWNINFWETLIKAQNEKLLRIKFAAQEIICDTDPVNPLSLVVWEAGKNQINGQPVQ